MEALTYKLEQFEGPLDLLMSLIDKNKVSIADIPISDICDQYIEYISEAKKLDMDIAAEFIVMASELMYIKSKILLPKITEDEEDPRAALADALLRYKQAKETAAKMFSMYAEFGGRMIKETDEISVDKTYVAPQDAIKLYEIMHRLVVQNTALEKAEKNHFAPLISRPIVSVELKIMEILDKLEKSERLSVRDLLTGAGSRADLIASFMGILELIKVRRILIEEQPGDTFENGNSVCDDLTILRLNPDFEAENEIGDNNDNNNNEEAEGGDQSV